MISTPIRLLNERWAPYYAGGAAWPEARYWGGDGSDFRRKTSYNGEQQIYVDPRYGGRETTPLGLDPFKVSDGILSIVASRTPPALKTVLFNNEYISGILTTQSRFSQKYGYFEMRAKIPVGIGVWPAFWMLADDGGWPPEVDIMEGRGQRPGDIVMTTHWRIPETQRVERCGFDFSVPDAATAFHDYGVLWQPDRITYFIDRQPMSEIKVPVGFHDPMYMIVNLAMGSKTFEGVGFVDGESPEYRRIRDRQDIRLPNRRTLTGDDDVRKILAPAFCKACRLVRARHRGGAGRRRSASRSRAAGACEFSERFRVGHRHLGLSDRGRRERRRPRPLDLGHLCAHAGQDRGQAPPAIAPTSTTTATRKTSA